jgi:predicted nuclease with TOPRIM domain
MGNMVGSFFFYSKYFEEIKNFVLNLPGDAVSIKECKKVLAKEDLHNQLQFIQTNFEKIPQCIKFLQGENIKLSVSFNKIEGLFEELKMIKAPITDKLKKKIDAIVSRNPDYHMLKQIATHTGFEVVRKIGNFIKQRVQSLF